METTRHDESIEVEEAAFEAGFNDTPVEQVTVQDEPKEDAQVAHVEQQDATIEGEDKPLTRSELQALLDRQSTLEQQLTKVHDRTHGKIGELQQRIEALKSAGDRISPKAKHRLSEEFPELAEILFSGGNEPSAEPDAPQGREDFASIIEAKVTARQDQLSQDMEKRLLKRDHKDWETVVAGDDFRQWVATLPGEEQNRLAASWDADFVSAKLSEFKESREKQAKSASATSQKADEQKKRLEGAIQVRGVPRAPSFGEDDEEAAMEKAFSG